MLSSVDSRMTCGVTVGRTARADCRVFCSTGILSTAGVLQLKRIVGRGYDALRYDSANVLGQAFRRRLADCGRRIRGLPPVWNVP